MNLVKVLRFLILADAVLVVATIVSDLATRGMLSPELLGALTEAEEALPLVLGLGSLLVLVLLVVAWIGLWIFWRPARTIYLAAWVLALLLTIFLGPYIETVITHAFESLNSGVGGAILALIYFSDVARRFSGDAALP
jgi:hypothetical protein